MIPKQNGLQFLQWVDQEYFWVSMLSSNLTHSLPEWALTILFWFLGFEFRQNAKRVSVILYKMWSSFRLLWCAITQVWFNWRFSSCSTAMLWIVHFQILTYNNWYSHTKSLNPLTEKYNLSLFDKFHYSELSISIPIGMLF